MRKRTYLFVTLFIAIVSIGLWFYFFGSNYLADAIFEEVAARAKPESISTETGATELGVSEQPTSDGSQASVQDAQLKNDFSAQENREIAIWAADRGWEIPEHEIDGKLVTESDSYSTYDENVLLQLAKQGDRKAAQIVGERWIGRPEQHAAAMNFLFDAAVRGYSKPFVTVAMHYQQQYFSSTASTEAKTENGAIAYGWAKVGTLRAEGNAAPLLSMMEKNLSPDELMKAEAFAEHLFAQLSEKRRTLGLGVFDNTIPESVKKSQERSRKFRAEMGSY